MQVIEDEQRMPESAVENINLFQTLKLKFCRSDETVVGLGGFFTNEEKELKYT